ncbi:hypothetical protein [Kordiimonas laminariae]|nr:hypothetical protein [Kordiimonas laminariae]MCK0069471.1 hypothetical protein [Kordiimonas laminariae]
MALKNDLIADFKEGFLTTTVKPWQVTVFIVLGLTLTTAYILLTTQ